MSYIELIDRAVTRLARPFAKADSWSEYAARAYWVLGGITLLCVILFLLGGGYLGGLLARLPAGILPYLKPVFEWFKLDNIIQTLPWSAALIVLYVAAGLVKKTREFFGRVLANSFYSVADGLINWGEWCIRHRGVSMLIIGFLAFTIGWGATGFYQAQSDKVLLEKGLRAWMDEAERFVFEEPLFNQNEERLVRVRDLWLDKYNGVLPSGDGGKHPAALLHEAMLELETPVDRNDNYAVSLHGRKAKFEELAARCAKPRLRRDDEAQTCDLLNILLAKLYNLFSDNPKITDDPAKLDYLKLEYLKRSLEYYGKVAVSDYKDDDRGRRFKFAVKNGEGTVYSGMITYLLQHEGAALETAPCKGMDDCVNKTLDAYDEAEKYLPAGKWNPAATAGCSRQRRKFVNNRADLLSRLGAKYELIFKNLTPRTLERSHMKSPGEMQRYIEEAIGNITACNYAGGDTLKDTAVTIAQAYGACIVLRDLDEHRPRAGTTAAEPVEMRPLTRDELARAAGFYLRVANSFEPAQFGNWELSYFCEVMQKNDALALQIGCALNDRALSGMPEVLLDDFDNRMGLVGEFVRQCRLETEGMDAQAKKLLRDRLRDKLRCGLRTSARQ
jgi:hypothetical protein